jgi:hypothetical protein
MLHSSQHTTSQDQVTGLSQSPQGLTVLFLCWGPGFVWISLANIITKLSMQLKLRVHVWVVTYFWINTSSFLVVWVMLYSSINSFVVRNCRFFHTFENNILATVKNWWSLTCLYSARAYNRAINSYGYILHEKRFRGIPNGVLFNFAYSFLPAIVLPLTYFWKNTWSFLVVCVILYSFIKRRRVFIFVNRKWSTIALGIYR